MDGTANRKKGEENIFIASLPRSGSTLLGMILNQQRDSFNIGESFYWNVLDPQVEVCTCGAKGCATLSEAYVRIKNVPKILKITEIVAALDAILERGNKKERASITAYFAPCMAEICEGFEELAAIFRTITGKKIIVDTSSNIVMAEALLEKKSWKIIILLRDPRGIIYSLKNAARRRFCAIPEDLWLDYVIDFAKRADSLAARADSIVVRYEDLCQNPRATLKRIFDFMGTEFQPETLKYRRNKGHVLMANRMRFGTNEEIKEDMSWKSGLAEKELEKINTWPDLVAIYNKFGYNFFD